MRAAAPLVLAVLLAAGPAAARVTERLDQPGETNGDVFDRRSDGSIQHRQSGLICPARLAGGAPLTWLEIYPMPATRGNDVSCGWALEGGGVVTLYAVKIGDYRPPVDFESYAAASARDVLMVHPGAAPAPVPEPPEAAPGSVLSLPRIQAWTFASEIGPAYSLLYLSRGGPWVVMIRATGPAGAAPATAARANAAWAAAARSVRP